MRRLTASRPQAFGRGLLFATALSTLVLGGCHIDMWVQSKPKAQDLNAFFAHSSSNPSSSRLPVPGTVAFGEDKSDTAFHRGYLDGKLVREFPIPVTRSLIARGKERFTVFCTHCHGQVGDGKGMIAQRGFNLERPIASYHTDRLRNIPVGHFFDVITNGYGAMYPQANRIAPTDRWAIAAYIRALQLSQRAAPGDLDEDTRKQLGGAALTAPAASGPLFATPSSAPTPPPAKVGEVDPAAASKPQPVPEMARSQRVTPGAVSEETGQPQIPAHSGGPL